LSYVSFNSLRAKQTTLVPKGKIVTIGFQWTKCSRQEVFKGHEIKGGGTMVLPLKSLLLVIFTGTRASERHKIGIDLGAWTSASQKELY